MRPAFLDDPAVHLVAAGTALPGPPVDNATLIRLFNLPPVWAQWIDTFVGTNARHFAVDLETGEIRFSLVNLGVTAARRALAAADIGPADVDLMVMATATPDRLMPATVNMIAEELGIDGIPTYQLQSGCTGAVQALSIACHLLRSAGMRTALVVGADTCAKHLDLTADVAKRSPSEQVNGLLFGDGAGAAVLSLDATPQSAMFRAISLRLSGLNREPGQIMEWFGLADRQSDIPAVREDYKAVEESVPKMAAETFQELLRELGWDEGDVGYVMPPQLSGRMTTLIAESLQVPLATEISCVADIGNTGNSLPFFQIERALPQMTAGDRAVGIAIEASKWIKAGFALEKL
jgi:3-oxoacyl-[acyl-carrier-protein] synthase III